MNNNISLQANLAKYEAAEIEFVVVDNADVICTSNGFGDSNASDDGILS